MAKPSHSSSTEKSVGSWSSTSSTPWPMACGIPAGTSTVSPAATGTVLRLASSASTRWAVDQLGQPAGVHGLAEAQVHDGLGDVGADDDPGLGLAPGAAEVAAGEVAVRVAVDGQALAGVQQLDQQRRVVAVGLGVAPAEEALRVGLDRLAQRAPVLQPGQAVAGRPEGGRGRADPVLGKERAAGLGRRVPRSSSMADPPR